MDDLQTYYRGSLKNRIETLDGVLAALAGEDPEAVVQVVRLAMDFRRAFQRDVFIDMYSYRRMGHNETDEPS